MSEKWAISLSVNDEPCDALVRPSDTLPFARRSKMGSPAISMPLTLPSSSSWLNSPGYQWFFRPHSASR